MRRKIEQLLNGKFEYEVKPLVIMPERVEREGSSLSPVTGHFTVSSQDERKVRGFLYSSNPRVTFDPAQFYAAKTQITYQADLTGLEDGEETRGFFTLCSDAGEYTLPFRFCSRESGRSAAADTVRQSQHDEAEGAGSDPDANVSGEAAKSDGPRTVEELEALARRDIYAARSHFLSRVFAESLRTHNADAYLFWENLHDAQQPEGGLEEFLIACRKKESVDITLSESYVEMQAPEASVRRSVEILAGTWGYLDIDISTDTHFLRLERKRVTTDEFVGGRFTLSYIVDTNFLHAGRNYGRIKVSTCYQTLYLDLQVERELGDAASAGRVQGLMRKKFLELYIDLRLSRIEMQSWIDRSMNVLTGYTRAGGRDLFADLLQAQLLFADGKKARGRRILGEIETHTHRFENAEQYAYYLYISTFYEQDPSYVDQVESRIEQLFLQHRDSWIIQWILLYLNERYLKDDSAKLEAILLQLQYGCCSPIMYVEACQIICRNPYLLRELDNVHCRLLLFAAKQGMIGEELAFHIANLTIQAPFYSSKLFRVLQKCYELNASRESLGAICACLIAGDKKEQRYFQWYSRGVDADVHITGLYEYYMETMEFESIGRMPQIIRMYFSYNHSLGYHKKAAIYRNISDNALTAPQVYRSNRQSIEHFVIEALAMGRIDENLAVLYERFLTRRLLTKSGAEQLVRMLFTCEITCKNPNMQSVLIMHRNLKKPQEIPLKNGTARGLIYSDDVCILLVDAQQRRFASSSLMQVKKLLDSPLLLSWCEELVPEHPALELYYVSREQEISQGTLRYFLAAQSDERLRESCKEQIRSMLMAWYLDHPRSEETYRFLTGIDKDAYVRGSKREIVSLLTAEGMYEDAFAILEKYGAERVELSCLVRICSQSVLIREFDENAALTDYCFQCFQSGKYDDNILTYLLMYYDGPIEEMKKLWNTGHQNEMDTMVLEEKILTLLIFTGQGSAGTERIFASYQSMLGRRKLCQAYLNLKAYEYLVRNLPVGDIVFEHLERLYLEGGEMEDVAKLALLQFYSNQAQLGDTREDIASGLIYAYNARGMRFAFFKNFSPELTRICQLEDKVFLEYATDPAHTVKLFYRRKGENGYISEPMRNCFEGIFVREFILFEEDELECYTEEYDGETLVSRGMTRHLSAALPPEDDQSRYALLCRMSALATAHESEALAKELAGYELTQRLTKELFQVS